MYLQSWFISILFRVHELPISCELHCQSSCSNSPYHRIFNLLYSNAIFDSSPYLLNELTLRYFSFSYCNISMNWAVKSFVFFAWIKGSDLLSPCTETSAMKTSRNVFFFFVCIYNSTWVRVYAASGDNEWKLRNEFKSESRWWKVET